MNCEVWKLGTVAYEAAWDLQKRLARSVAAGERGPILLLLEHPHTYTFGRRGNPDNLLWDEAERARRDVSVHWVDRGGDVTYHGPGQLVGYPILPLAPGGVHAQSGRIPQADYVGYVRKLEKVLIRTIADLGLATGQIQGLTGVWVQPDVASRCRHCPPEAKKRPSKIAAIGVKVDARGVSQHGFALNVESDPDYWEGIVGCGLEEPVVNLNDLIWEPVELEHVTERLITAFGQVFGYEMNLVEVAEEF
jgi:lipoate-protein ligase B